MRWHLFPALVSLTLVFPLWVNATSFRLTVVDATGAGFPDVLVIVKSLDGKGEIFRMLTDEGGKIPDRELAQGLYRIIATCPYGICETEVRECLVREKSVELELKVAVSPTKGNVAVIGPTLQMRVQVLNAAGMPAESATLLVRDADAVDERWYKTDANGEVKVTLPDGVVTFVVVFKDSLARESVERAKLEGLVTQGKKLVIQLR